MAGGKMTRVYTAPTRQRRLNFRQVKQVQKIVQSNKLLKHNYASISGGFNTTPVLYEIATIPKGDEIDQRDSDRIAVQSLKMSFGVYNTQAGVNTVRIIVARSKQTVLVAANFPTTIDGSPDFDTMQIYMDKVYSFGTAGSAAFENDEFYKSFKNKRVPHLNIIYDEDVSATIPRTNNLYVFAIATGTSGVIQGYAHLKFFDKD